MTDNANRTTGLKWFSVGFISRKAATIYASKSAEPENKINNSGFLLTKSPDTEVGQHVRTQSASQ